MAPVWHKSFTNELARLANGLPYSNIKGTNTITFVSKSTIPTKNRITYGRIVVDVKPHKVEKYRTRLTVGGNLLTYDHDTFTPTADLVTIKALINSTISTPNARFITCDVANFYLNTTLPSPEYMKLKYSIIPPDIIKHYKLENLHNPPDDYIYIKITNGMYGLKQAGILAHNELKQHLEPYGYAPVKHTPGLWRHTNDPTTFTLVVNDFGIKYTNKNQVNHLLQALSSKYKITTDWSGSLYCGLTLSWNYQHRHVDISMPNYINQVLEQHNHIPPYKPVHTPSSWAPITYRKGPQLTQFADTTPRLNPAQIKTLQKVIGSLLFYARSVDPTILLALGDLASAQTTATERTQRAMKHLLDYLYTHSQAVIRYHKSDMVLHSHSDASYLSAPKSRSRAGGYFFLDKKQQSPLL